MANQLEMAVVQAMLTLKRLGWSQRRIDRQTLARYIHSPPAHSKPATNPIPGPESLCEPFRAVIEDKLRQGLTGQRVYQDLVEVHGFTASYFSVRRFRRRLGHSEPIPFRRLGVLPGEQAQVDSGTGASILRADGKRRRPHVLRVVLSFSRRILFSSLRYAITSC